MNKPYKLDHPLYPHPKAIEHIKKFKMNYEPHAGSFDFRYNRWYEACRADIEEGLASERELYHFVTAVYRTRDMNAEKIFYKEYIVGKDRNEIPHTFDHFVGMFEVLQIDRYFNYSSGKPATRYTGNTEKHYYIDYSPEIILELAELAPNNKRQNYYIIGQGEQKLTHDVFFTPITFAYMDFDDLNEIARSPLVSDSMRNKIRAIQNEHDSKTIKVKNQSPGSK